LAVNWEVEAGTPRPEHYDVFTQPRPTALESRPPEKTKSLKPLRLNPTHCEQSKPSESVRS
jgi:hypothetical protein